MKEKKTPLKNTFGKDAGKSFLQLLSNLLSPALTFLAGYLILALLAEKVWPALASPDAYGYVPVLGGIAMAGGFLGLLMLLYLSRKEGRENDKTMRVFHLEKDKKPPFYGWILLLVFSGFAGISLNYFLLITGFSEADETFTEVAASQFGVPLWTGLLLYALIAPLAEEMLFRFFIFRRAALHFKNPLPAALLSALLFGLYHGNPVQFVYGAVFGILLAAGYLRFGTFLAPVLMHSAANLVVYLAGELPEVSDFLMNPGRLLGEVCVTFVGIYYLVIQPLQKRKKDENNSFIKFE